MQLWLLKIIKFILFVVFVGGINNDLHVSPALEWLDIILYKGRVPNCRRCLHPSNEFLK